MATLAERIAAAEALAAAAEARVSDPKFVEEEAARKRLSDAESRARSAFERERDLLVSRALDDAPDGAEAVLIEAPLPVHAAKPATGNGDAAPASEPVPHFFIVQGAGAKPYREYQQGIRDAMAEKIQKGTRNKIDRDDVDRIYAVAGTIQWYAGSEALDLDDSDNGKAFNDFLRANPAVVTQIVASVSRLDGAASDARKR